jgi:hypothetical protein
MEGGNFLLIDDIRIFEHGFDNFFQICLDHILREFSFLF